MTDSKTPIFNSPISAQDQPDQVAEAFADRLMDELFDNVERALEGDEVALETLSASPANSSADAPAISDLTLTFSEGGLPAVLLSTNGDSSLTTSPGTLTTAIPPAEATDASPPPKKRWLNSWTLNQALLGAAGLTLLATLGLWFYQRQQIAALVPAPAASPAETVATNPHSEFLEYLRRSLDIVAQNTVNTAAGTTGVPDVAIASGSNVVNLPSIANNTLPTQPLPGGTPASPGSVNVIERVYIPYPSTQSPTSSPTAQLPSPRANTPSTAAAVASPTSPTNVTPALNHKLVGVLELGDRSAALVEVNGVPQRIYIGERIAASGWSLVSVANEEVVIRRNGEVRTLYIGQQF